MSSTRQLAAIMFTDIVGYTALMGTDDQKALSILQKNRSIQKPIIEEFKGQWIKELGDGVMASFDSAINAVYAAIKIQETCRELKEFQLKIGIHLGDVLFENNDVLGDGVNIAARIEAASGPGCIFISESVQSNIANRQDIRTRFVREELLKNVIRPIRIYEVLTGEEKQVISLSVKEEKAEKSIAVLPFVNMSSDPEQEYFSDGISEEIINVLAQVPDMKVIGRTSSFAFKGKNQDLREIGNLLSVSYVLEGSVRKAGNRLRITAQLINAADGFHLYSEKFDRGLEDIFAIQDEISLAILEAVKIKLIGEKREIVQKSYTDNTEVYQLYLLGRFHVNKYSPDGFIKAIEYFESAVALDSNYAIAYSEMAFCCMNLTSLNWAQPDKTLLKAVEFANKALELDNNIAETHLNVGRIKLHFEYKIHEAEIEFNKAIAINSNSAEVYIQLGFCAALLGNNKLAIEYVNKAIGLDPFSLINFVYIAAIYWTLGDHKKHLSLAKQAVEMAPDFPVGHAFLGWYYRQIKSYNEAIPELELAVKIYPDLQNLSHLGCTYALMGEKRKALEIIERMKNIQWAELAGNAYLGRIYAYLGEWETAYLYFEKAVENHEAFLLWTVKNEIDHKNLRAQLLLEKMGQPFK